MARVKICGITNIDDAMKAAELGAYALGFIFYRESPRYIPPVKAAAIVKQLPPFVGRVGVFVNMNLQGVLEIIKRAGLSAVQLHGNETHEFCYQLHAISSIPIIKVFRIQDESSFYKIENFGYAINAILLDTYKDDTYGGTGETFNWRLADLAKKAEKPVILSGGLNTANVVEAFKSVKPYAIDINSGIEISPGIKDHYMMKSLFDKLSDFN